MTRQATRTQQRKQADALFSRVVRSVGRCEASGSTDWPCGGNLQCAHVHGRRYLIIRHERMNAVCLCAAHHIFYTNRPIEWEDWCRRELGSAVYDELRRKALTQERPDYLSVIRALKVELGELAA